MKNNRLAAIIAGALYIAGTVTGILSRAVGGGEAVGPISGMFVAAMGLSLSGMAVALYPVLRKFNETLAIGYIVFRGGLEGFAYLMSAAIMFVQPLVISQNAIDVQPLADGLLKMQDALGFLMTIVFIIGAVMFYAALYQSRLTPRWLAGWGLISTVPYLVAAFLVMFGGYSTLSPLAGGLQFPLFLQEMTLAVWLIVKGFNPAAFKSLQA